MKPIKILQITLALVPIIMGIDKFFNLVSTWTVYVPQFLASITPSFAQNFMYLAGVVEIVIGFLVFFKPKLGAVLSILLYLGIVFDLLFFINHYYNIVILDTALASISYAYYKLLK